MFLGAAQGCICNPDPPLKLAEIDPHPTDILLYASVWLILGSMIPIMAAFPQPLYTLEVNHNHLSRRSE